MGKLINSTSVTDIGYDDADARHTVASQRYPPWEAMGQRWREWNHATAAAGRMEEQQERQDPREEENIEEHGGEEDAGVACGMSSTDRRRVATAALPAPLRPDLRTDT